MNKNVGILALALFSTVSSAQVNTSKLDEKLELEFKSILETIENNYGPIRLKQMTVGLDWDQARAQYMQELKQVRNTTEYFNLVARVFGSLQDAHVSVELPSSLVLKYPFDFIYAEGKTLVATTPKKMKDCSVAVGDELLAINNKSPADLRAELARFRGMGNENSDNAYLTSMLGQMSEKRGVPVRLFDAPIETFSFKKASDGTAITCLMDLKPTGVSFVDRAFHEQQVPTPKPSSKSLSQAWEQQLNQLAASEKISSTELNQLKRLNHILALSHKLVNLASNNSSMELAGNLEFNGKKIVLGDKKPFFKLPKNFRRIKPNGLFAGMLDSANFFAGTFKRDDKTIGFLRIPSYMPENPLFMLFSIRYYIEKLEKKSDMLIIDQTNNPGGMVAFSDMIISHLVAKKDDQIHMGFKARPTQDFLRTFLELKNSIETESNTSSYLNQTYLPKLDKEFQKVYQAYVNGDELSEPVSLRVISDYMEDMLSSLLRKAETNKITFLGRLVEAVTIFKGVNLSKKIVYSKPIYMWINELDFSGGDATPAVLQDYGRVTLVGTNTAGAGGSVNEYEQGVLHKFKFNLTTSLMYRPANENPYVENYGVNPDIDFAMTALDVRDQYTSIFERFLTRIGL
jgi:hypothetical protein